MFPGRWMCVTFRLALDQTFCGWQGEHGGKELVGGALTPRRGAPERVTDY